MVAVVFSRDRSLASACADALAAGGHEVRTIDSVGGNLEVGIPEVVVVLAGTAPDLAFVDEVRRLVGSTVEAMVAAGGGRVVLVVPATGLPGTSWTDESATAAWGLVGLARSTARQVAASGVTVNVVRLGVIDRGGDGPEDPAQVSALSEIVASTPIKRTGTTDEVAAAVAYLASPEASYVTGLVLPVDGGLTIGQGA